MTDNLTRINAILERLVHARNSIVRHRDYDLDLRSVLPQLEISANIFYEEVNREIEEISRG